MPFSKKKEFLRQIFLPNPNNDQSLLQIPYHHSTKSQRIEKMIAGSFLIGIDHTCPQKMSETTEERFKRLQAKEQELREREKALRKQNVDVDEEKANNFPPFCPVVHHNIIEDIPIVAQWTIKIAFIAQFIWILQLLLNFIAACSTGSMNSYSVAMNAVFSLAIMILGVPCGFKLNYMKHYTNASKDGMSVSNLILQVLFIAVNIYALIGLKNQGVMGVLTTIDALAGGNGFSRIMIPIAAAFWGLQVAIQIFLFGKIIILFKNKKKFSSAAMTTKTADNDEVVSPPLQFV